jgi:hypothetical protein
MGGKMSIDPDKLKKFGDDLMIQARVDLSVAGVCYPAVIVFKSDTEWETIQPDMATEQDIANVDKLLRQKALEEDVQAIVFLMDAHMKDIEEGDSVPASLAKDPEAIDVLYIAVYQPDSTEIRQTMYSKKGGNNPVFLDMEWESISGEKGLLMNPWLTSK